MPPLDEECVRLGRGAVPEECLLVGFELPALDFGCVGVCDDRGAVACGTGAWPPVRAGGLCAARGIGTGDPAGVRLSAVLTARACWRAFSNPCRCALWIACSVCFAAVASGLPASAPVTPAGEDTA